MSDALVAVTVGPTDLVSILQGNAIVLASVGQILSAPNAAIVALTQRVAVLEGRADPCVALSGTIPVATVQVGTTMLSVAVTGLLAADRVAVEPVTDLPAGLVLAWAHPAFDGVLTVALTAGAVVALAKPVALAVTALR